ncbi:MAG TPA: hypothetical protein VHZ51_28230 [Ktedonobacteraceae bacterium]|nr:hypothetical protein [Ktedonobacteraceae bacterium]
MSNDFEPKSRMTRRSMLHHLGVTSVSALTLAGVAYEASSVLTPTPAYASEATPLEGIDASHATPDLVSLLTGFFAAKSAHDPARTMSYYSQKKLTYIDGTLGLGFYTWQDLNAFFTKLMPTWPPAARSYPVRILGDTTSALVFFTDTPELFGHEIRTISPINFEQDKVVRWVDYWDGRHFGVADVAKLRTPADQFPQDFKESTVGETASPIMRQVAAELAQAFVTNNAAAAGQLFAPDAVFEDMTLHTQVIGQLAITGYLQRALPQLPYGYKSAIRHVVGSALGGGYEWTSSIGSVPRGVLGLELNQQSQVTRLTAVWDGSLLDDAEFNAQLTLTIEH